MTPDYRLNAILSIVRTIFVSFILGFGKVNLLFFRCYDVFKGCGGFNSLTNRKNVRKGKFIILINQVLRISENPLAAA